MATLFTQTLSPITLTVLVHASLVAAIFFIVFFEPLRSFALAGPGNQYSIARFLFATVVCCGRTRNQCCRPCDRAAKRYPVASTCQIPFFTSLSDVYTFVFGYREKGIFVEVGAYDGESFSNTSTLADLGWRGHYVEPIPAYAAVCAARHAKNRLVTVHSLCVGARSGEQAVLSSAGPLTSAVADEIQSVSSSNMNSALRLMGWSHESSTSSKTSTAIVRTTTSLADFFEHALPEEERYNVDILVIDTEGMEWSILQTFQMAKYHPKLVIVEIQELQNRYRDNLRVQADAEHTFAYFAAAGYSILYKDVVNTIFIHEDCPCVGGN